MDVMNGMKMDVTNGMIFFIHPKVDEKWMKIVPMDEILLRWMNVSSINFIHLNKFSFI
jgi:hypothetical protein